MIVIKNRQLEILLFLLQVKKTTYSELTERFEISRRTAMRDIDFLSAMGIPIYSQPGYGGGIFIPREYKVGETFFTPEEISSLVFALHLTKYIHKEETEKSILKKLELLIPDLVFLKESNYSDRVKVELMEKPISTDPAIWHVIDEAMDQKKWLKITAAGQEYLVEPMYYLICQKGLLLQCRDEKSEYALPVLDMTACSLSTPDHDKK